MANDLVESFEAHGAEIEIRADRFGKRRFWAMVNGTALFQRGRMRLRMFATVPAARSAARKEAKTTTASPPPKKRGVPGYSNFGGGGPFAPIGSPSKGSKEKP